MDESKTVDRSANNAKSAEDSLFCVLSRKRKDHSNEPRRVCVGGSISNGVFCFPKGSEHVVCAAGRRMRVYNPQTGIASQEVRIADYLNVDETVELIEMNNIYTDVIYTLSSKNCIDAWSLESDSPVKSIQFNSRVVKAISDPKTKFSLYVLTCNQKKASSRNKEKRLDYQLYRVNMDDRSSVNCILTPNVGKKAGIIKISRSGEVILSSCGKELHMLIASDAKNTLKTIRIDDEITCMCVSPDDSMIAVGDKSGRITLMHLGSMLMNNNRDLANDVPRTTLHWHSQRVNCVEFSIDGLVLVSGGLEMVLVFWYLEDNLKRFLPRLQSPIETITSMPNGSSIMVLFSDNSAGMFDMGSMLRTGTIPGPNEVTAGRDCHRRPFTRILDNSYLVLEKRNGVIQFFNYITDRPVFEVDVTCETIVSHPDSADALGSRIECLLISNDGRWMVTTDRYDADSDEKGVSTTIKLWNRFQSGYGFTLSTRICSAHKGRIVSADISPSKSPMFATVSEDQTFKIWTFKDGKWASSLPQNFRNETPLAVTFSRDGAILAVVYSKIISLWDPFTLTLMATLPFQEAPKSHRSVHFVLDSHLVVHNTKKICVWDLTSLSVLWCIYAPVISISALNNSNIFSVAVENSRNSATILLFDVLSPVPIHEITTRSGYVCSKLLRLSPDIAVLVLYSDNTVRIYSATQNSKSLVLQKQDSKVLEAGSIAEVPLPKHRKSEPALVKFVKPYRTSSWISDNPQYATTPSHMLGSAVSLCSEYLRFCRKGSLV